MIDSTPTTATHSDLSEEEAYERVKRIVAEAFPAGRTARSLEYRSGMTQMLLYFFCGKKVNSPYQEGSSEHDAFFAGCDAGRHHWRLMADK